MRCIWCGEIRHRYEDGSTTCGCDADETTEPAPAVTETGPKQDK
jgi:hypothetical protein